MNVFPCNEDWRLKRIQAKNIQKVKIRRGLLPLVQLPKTHRRKPLSHRSHQKPQRQKQRSLRHQKEPKTEVPGDGSLAFLVSHLVHKRNRKLEKKKIDLKTGGIDMVSSFHCLFLLHAKEKKNIKTHICFHCCLFRRCFWMFLLHCEGQRNKEIKQFQA